MEDEEIKCKECPSAIHGFDRNASHNAGRYVCECESFVCPSEQFRQRVQELEQQLTEVLERERAAKFPDDNFWLKLSEQWSE